MTAAYRLKGLGWFGGVVIASLGFYLVSLQVAAERKRLAQVDAKIHAAERDIRALETEFDVRANLAQLERWNGDILALSAPTAGQFVRDEGALASISFGAAGTAPAVQTAALVVPALPSLVQPAVVDAVPAAAPAARPATIVKVAAAAAPARVTVMRVATAETPTIAKAVLVAAKEPAATVRKARAVAMLDQTLLSDSTIGDLLSGARAERGRFR